MEPSFSYVDEDSIEEELLCNQICFGPLVDPVVHKGCSNSFCRACIRRANWKCPTCNTGRERDFSNVNSRIVTNLLSRIPVKCSQCNRTMPRGEFNSHKTRCEFPCPRGCSENISMSQLVAHEDVCENVEVHCSAVDLGCTTILPRRSIGEHTENCHVEKSRCFIEPLKEENIELREHLETTFDMVQRLQREVENIKRRQQLYQPKLVEKIACFCDSTIFVINTTSGAVERTLGGDTQAITCIALLDSHDIASASAPGIVKIWNVRSGTCLVTFITGTVWLMRGACSKLFTGGDANVHVYSRDPSAKKIFECDPVVCIHENGCFVTAARGVLKEYNDKGRLISEARYPAVCTIESLVKTNDGTMVTMAHQENFFRVWRKNDRTQTLSERKFHVHTDAIDCIILLSDGRIASCGKDMTVHVTEIQGETSNLSTVLRDHTDRVVSITEINPGVIVSSSRDKTIRVWNNSRCVKVIPVEHTMLGLTPYK